MGQRLVLQEILIDLLGSSNVYFQPPDNLTMSYPAIVYSRDYDKSQYADNELYLNTKRYQVTVMDRNPDSLIPDKVRRLPLCSFRRSFVADGLNQDVFDLYY